MPGRHEVFSPKSQPAGFAQTAPVRVAVVVDEFPLLSETFVIDQIVALLQSGLDVRIVADRRARQRITNEIANDLLDRSSFIDDHPLVRLLPRNPIGRKLRALLMPLLGHRMDRKRLADVDVVLCHFGPNGLRAAKALAPLKHPPKLWTMFHGYDLSSYLRDKGDDVYAPLFAAGDHFLAVSRHWTDRLNALGCPPDRTAVLHMGVDTKTLRFTPPARTAGQPLRIISIGRLVEKKGYAVSIAALAALGAQAGNLDWRYDIIGDGPLDATLKAQVADLGLGDRVNFLGPLPPSRVLSLLAQADIFLLPSMVAANGDMEGIPVALMEAMALGIPVVSSIHSGIPELIEHEYSGLLAPEGDVQMVATHILRLAMDPYLGKALAFAARAHVEDEFDHGQLMCDLVRSVCANSSPAH